MAKVTQVQNGDTGAVARTAYNEAIKDVEVDDSTIKGDGINTALNSPLAATALQPGEAATPAQGALADSALQSTDIGVTVQAHDTVLDNTTASYTTAEETKLSNIEANAEVNTINTTTTGEPTGSDVVLNVVSLTQAEFDAGTPVATTIYNITDA